MKKITLFIFSLIVSFVLFCGFFVKADVTLTMTDGAQIRTAGEFQGLRFQASASSLDGTDEHGFYLAAGEHSLSDMRTAIEASALTVGGSKLVKKSTTGEDLDFAVTVYGMDAASEYAQVITAVAYVKTGASFTFDKAVTRNIAEKAREMYNASETPAEIVATVAAATKVKVTGSDSSVAYYADLDDVTFADGDTAELVRGTYSDAVTISADGVKVLGNTEYNLKHDDTYSAAFTDTVLRGAVTVTGDDFELANVVFSNQIKLNAADDAYIHNSITTTPVTNDILYAIGTITAESKNLIVEKVAVAGSVNRFIYAYGAVLNGLTVDSCCVLDSVSINSGSGTGICDYIRFGTASNEQYAAGVISITNCYIRGFQSGFMERLPTTATSYVFENNYFKDIPVAIYFRTATVSITQNHTIRYNTFIRCGKNSTDWDLMNISNGNSTTTTISYNAFVDSDFGTGTFGGKTYTDYIIMIRNASKGTFNLANNYFWNTSRNDTADFESAYCIKNPSQAGTPLSLWSLESPTTTPNTYEPYQVVEIGGHYYIYGINLTTE